MAELQPGPCVLALACAQTPEGARTLASSSLEEGYAHVRHYFVQGWEDWGSRLELPASTPELHEEAMLSATALQDMDSRPLGLGMHGVLLDARRLASARSLEFTRLFRAEERWEGIDHDVALASHPVRQHTSLRRRARSRQTEELPSRAR